MKIQRISEYQGILPFPNLQDSHHEYFTSFLGSNLGKIYQALPWQELVQVLGLKDHKKGPMSLFSPRGKIGLMFLKHYACCSDEKLIEQLNGNRDYQYFCDIYIPPTARLTNFKIVSEIRCEIAARLDIDSLQKILAQHWLPYCTHLESMTCDATCYESSIRYPTDVKLLWESVEWTYEQVKRLSKMAGVKMIRSRKKKWTRRYVSYSKMKRKTKKKRIPLIRASLLLLDKFNAHLTYLEEELSYQASNQYQQRRIAIQIIYEQQYGKFHHDNDIKDRIVSIDKPYIRPIVRGKEIKKTEFGAKVNKFQIDGISFIEHLSFDNFHEGNRLMQTVQTTEGLTHTKVKVVGADAIYATNANRKEMTQRKIQTDFKRKGRAGKHEKQRQQLAKMITKERASRLEGSFGTDKECFLLKRIRARTKETEILWIFLGIHTSNALKIGRRMAQQIQKAA